ncbi:unnamed protein product [Phytophthora fragariaefolia]|uniref:Unnamed protein product n=1 Tax=Phytophthora fragariaefolia TaxID=1490495 RepID=A0A9W6TRG1_9STRA|nr:unnamed protein product [Phytophthora fragariaefolia]
MEESDDMDALLCLTEVYLRYESDLSKARAELHRLLLFESWRIAMRSRHYLSTECLDTPCESAWMSLYMNASDTNFLNATSLTRYAPAVFTIPFGCHANQTLLCLIQIHVPPIAPAVLKILYYSSAFVTRPSAETALPTPSAWTCPLLLRRLDGAEHALPAIWCTASDSHKNASQGRGGSVAGARGLRSCADLVPSPAQQVRLAKLVEAREPLLKHTFGFIDGKNLRVRTELDLY